MPNLDYWIGYISAIQRSMEDNDAAMDVLHFTQEWGVKTTEKTSGFRQAFFEQSCFPDDEPEIIDGIYLEYLADKVARMEGSVIITTGEERMGMSCVSTRLLE